MKTIKRYSKETKQRAIRLVHDHQSEYPSLWAATVSIASKIGCTPESLRTWIRQNEIDNGQRVGLNSADSDRIKALEREVKELRKTNEILRLASAFFAQAELDRPRKK